MIHIDVQNYIEEIKKMTKPQEVMDFLSKLLQENPNDQQLGDVIRRIVNKKIQ